MANEFRVKNGIISSSIATDSGDFTIDSAADVVIDADGADVILKDDGTEFGRFKRDSSNFVIKSATNDKDIIFKGVDNSATITALTLDMSEAGAATFGGGIADTGTIAAGTWNGGVIASAYLDADTAHLSGSQTFTGTKTLNSFKGTGSVTVTNILDEDDMSSDSNTALATQQSIKKYVDDSVGSAGGGDITAVTAGVGLSGGGTTGGVTLTLDMSELTDMTADVTDNADEFIILDGGADRRKMMNEIDVGGFRDVITGPFHFETDQENVALGEGALDSLTQYVSGLVANGGNNNTAIGENAGTAVSTGDSNTLLGHDAGETITTGSSNTVIGADAEPSAVDASNQIVIGSGAVGLADNAVVIGNTSITAWLPPDDAGVDLGSSSYQFKDGYFHGTLEADAITVNGTAAAVSGGAFHDGFSDFVANEHIDHSGVTITAGTGMTGGGTIAATRTLNVIGGDGITANADDVAITAAQTTITSILNASLVAGRDAHNQIKFSTDDQIIFRVGNADGVIFKASGEIEATKFDGALEGNADTATALATARTIGGVSFDGTAAITVSSATGDFSIGDDLTLGSNAAVINFGGDSEIKLTHVHDTGLLLTDSGGSPTLQLHDANESVSSDGSKLILTSNGVAFSMPTADGSNGQQLTTNGSGTLSWAASGSSGGGMSDLVDDTSPQLGADLDTNSFNIKFDDAHGIHDDSNNEQLLFGKTTSANSYIKIWNGISDTTAGTLFGTDVVSSSGNTVAVGRMTGPGFEATGDETDVGMSFKTKGLGSFVFTNDDATNAASPSLILLRNNLEGEVADDDDIGIIKFMGADSAMVEEGSVQSLHDYRDYARIGVEIPDQTSGNADGELYVSILVKDSQRRLLAVGSNNLAHGDTPAAGVAAKAGQLRTFSSNQTLDYDDYAGLYLVATSAMTFTLPASPNRGEQYVIISNTTGTVTISADGSDTMNGSTSNQTITTRYEAKTCIAVSASEWIVLG